MALTVATIDLAIEEILTSGQSHSLDGTSLSKASIGELRQLRESIQSTETKKTGGQRPVFRSFNMRGAAND